MALKIVHISTHDNGGAGLAAYHLHRGLLEKGVESRMIVANKTRNDDTIVQVKPDETLLYQPPKNALLRKYKKIMRRRGKYLTRYEHTQKGIERLRSLHPNVFFTSPISTYELSTHPLVQDADIIHLHWIQNYLNYETFFSHVSKPIVWTLHDLNPMMGGFHHTIWKDRYYKEYQELEDSFYNIKKDSLTFAKEISLIAISKQMHRFISNHEFFCGKRIFDIPVSINGNNFQCHNRQIVRELLSIPEEKMVFLFVNKNLNDEMKGLHLLIKALEILNLESVTLVCVGDGEIPVSTHLDIRHFSSVSDTEWLSQLYSLADFLVLPSLQESFSQTAIEAICCGTPVIMTPVGIGEELISTLHGTLCADFTPEAIADGIRAAMNRNYDRAAMRNNVLSRFGIDVVVKKHLDMYNIILESLSSQSSQSNPDVTLPNSDFGLTQKNYFPTS